MEYHIDSNAIRVRTVLLDVFPNIYKHMILNMYPPPAVAKLIELNGGKFCKNITKAERKIIKSVNTSLYGEVDGPIMYKIIRCFNLIEKPTNGWGKKPKDNHINQGDDAERMRFFRNFYVHKPNLKVSDEDFQDFFIKSSEIAGRLDIAACSLNRFKEQVTKCKTYVIRESDVERDKMFLSEIFSFTLDSGSGGEPTRVSLYYGNDISDQFRCYENEETGSNEYIMKLYIDGKTECQRLVDVLKDSKETCSSPAIQIQDIELGSVILHILIARQCFTSCESLHNEIQIFINAMFCHEEIQRSNMSDFDMVLAIADYTEQGAHDTRTISSDDSYLIEDVLDPWNIHDIQGVKLHLNIQKKTFANRNDFFSNMESFFKAVMSSTNIHIPSDTPVQAILMKCDQKEGIQVEETSLQVTKGTAAIETGIQIDIHMKEKVIKANKSTETAKGGEDIGIPLVEIGMLTKKSAQAATKESEIEIKVEETNLQTNTGTAAIEADIQIGMVKAEKDLKAYKSTKEAEGEKTDIQLEDIGISTNERAQTASGGEDIRIPPEEIGMITKRSEQAAEKVPIEELNVTTDQSADAVTDTISSTDKHAQVATGSKIVSTMLETTSTTNQNAQAARENKAMLCTYSTCKTELLSGSNFCHKCGYEQQIIIEQEKVFKSLDIDEIANTLDSDGRKEEFRKIYQEKIESWKVKDVKFCITGASRTGKSSFINAITGCQEGQKGFAPVSVYGDTTNKGACYIHPKHSKLQLWDLPRFGTVQHKSKGYVNDMEFKKFDYVLIFFEVMSENDIWLAKQLKSHMKSFCFVRSKLDQDKTNDKQHDCNTIAYKIRTKALGDLEKEQISGVDVFVISSADTTIGHFESLINHMENILDEGK